MLIFLTQYLNLPWWKLKIGVIFKCPFVVLTVKALFKIPYYQVDHIWNKNRLTPNWHQTLFQRSYIVIWTLWTLGGHWQDVVCLTICYLVVFTGDSFDIIIWICKFCDGIPYPFWSVSEILTCARKITIWLCAVADTKPE